MQFAQAIAQTKNCKRACFTNAPKQTKMDRKQHDRKEGRSANRRLAQWRVKWLIKHSTSHQLLWYIDGFVLRNPPLRQAPKRCVQP